MGLRLLVSIRFQVSFTPLVGVLFTFPSRYLCTIGRQGVFRLGGWSPHVQTGFHVPRPTQGSLKALRLRGCHPLRPTFPDCSASLPGTTGLLRFRSPLLAESLLMSFPPGTEMFQFPGFASRPYGFRPGYPKGVGFPIRTSADQRSLASPRGFSQRATSFIASWRQGIHRMPFSHSILSPPPAHRAKPRPTASFGRQRPLHPRPCGLVSARRCAALTHTPDHLHHVKEHHAPPRHPAPSRGSRTAPWNEQVSEVPPPQGAAHQASTVIAAPSGTDTFPHTPKAREEMETVGFEPTTPCLQSRCSPTELRPRGRRCPTAPPKSQERKHHIARAMPRISLPLRQDQISAQRKFGGPGRT
jgi:hypothetical protein